RRSTWHGTFLGAFQGRDQTDGEDERIHSRAQTGHLPLQERARSRGHPAVWPRGRGGGKGQPRSGSSRRRGESLHRALRSGECDVTQRISETTSQGGRTQSNRRETGKGNQSTDRWSAKGQRAN